MCAIDNKQITSEILGARLFVNIFFKRQRIKALYDTGAAVSVMNEKVFQQVLKSGAVVRSIPNAKFPSLTTASGSQMSISGIYMFVMSVAGRTFSAPIIVSPDIQNQCIIGMNIIRGVGLVYDTASDTLGYIDSNPVKPQLPPVDEVTLLSLPPT